MIHPHFMPTLIKFQRQIRLSIFNLSYSCSYLVQMTKSEWNIGTIKTHQIASIINEVKDEAIFIVLYLLMLFSKVRVGGG